MQVKYYPETDSLLIRLSDNPSAETEELARGANVDFDKDGRPVALEVIEHASQWMSLDAVAVEGLFRGPWSPDKIQAMRESMNPDARDVCARGRHDTSAGSPLGNGRRLAQSHGAETARSDRRKSAMIETLKARAMKTMARSALFVEGE